MKFFFEKHPNLIKILGTGLIAFLICLPISNKIKNQNVKIDESLIKESLSIYKEKLKTSSKNPYELVVSGTRQLNSNEIDMALITLEQAAQKDKNYRDAWLYLGVAYLKNSDYNSAVKALELAKQIDPIYPPVYQYLALAYEKTGDVELSKECYNKYNQLNK